jgi:hypothetical protein
LTILLALRQRWPENDRIGNDQPLATLREDLYKTVPPLVKLKAAYRSRVFGLHAHAIVPVFVPNAHVKFNPRGKRRLVAQPNFVAAGCQVQSEPSKLTTLRSGSVGQIEACVATPVGWASAESVADPKIGRCEKARIAVVNDRFG